MKRHQAPLVHIITLMDVPESRAAAERCAQSVHAHGLESRLFPAFTPADDPRAIFAHNQWPTAKFDHNRFSRPLPCMACFASHADLWRICHTTATPMVICEHDAVMVRPLPDCGLALCINLGKPSYGRWKQPSCGLGPLVSKPHFPGAHAYFLHPHAAGELLRVARHAAEPTDVYLSYKRFLWLRESFPYPFECDQRISTIQNPAGCQAKHQPVTIL